MLLPPRYSCGLVHVHAAHRDIGKLLADSTADVNQIYNASSQAGRQWGETMAKETEQTTTALASVQS